MHAEDRTGGAASPIQPDAIEQAISSAVCQRMATVPLRSIKVAPLCRSCGVSRSAFYDRFVDVYDVAARLEEQLLRELDALVEDTHRPGLGNYEICLTFLSFFARRRALVRALLSNETAGRVRRELDVRLVSSLERALERRYDLEPTPPEELGDILAFACAGFYHFYLDDGPSPDDATLERRARIAATFCDAGLRSLLGAR